MQGVDPEEQVLSGRYEILDRLATGGMAHVYRGRDHNLEREVAIKVLRDDFLDDPAFLSRFLLEARAAANLIHPNIVTIYDFGHEDRLYFMVMEYMPGANLKTLMRRRGIFSTHEAIEWMVQICAGVGYAHRAGLVHCDIKPQNILISAEGRAKITDFGIARALAGIQPDEHLDIVWGSPQYLAPEQAAGMPPSPASDVYALGIILFEMLTGQLPFSALDPDRLAELHQASPPPFPRHVNPAIPPALEQIILKVLSKEPAARYRTADQLGRVLANLTTTADQIRFPAASEDSHPQALTAPLGGTPPAPLDWIAVGLGLLAFLLIGGLIPVWLWACLLYPSCPLTIP
jgi:eukaryotic-like serine/threonine-protein kinase